MNSDTETQPREKSEDVKPFTRVRSGVNLPTFLQTRQRADTGATKESSNDDDIVGHKSPLRATAAFPDPRVLQSISTVEDQEKPWHHTKLEKIESLGS